MTFVTTYVPGAADTKAFEDEVVKPVLGETPNPRKRIGLRRLHTEAFMMYSAEQKRKIQNPDSEDKPRHLAPAERKSRMDILKSQLTGLELSGNLAPSNLLVDKFVDMQEKGVLRYLEWQDLTTREQELRNIKIEEYWKIENGLFKRFESHTVVSTDGFSEAKLRFSLQRRGIAMNLARLCSFVVHEKLINFLMKEYCRTPPTNFAAVSLEQVYEADREIFVLMAEWTEGYLDMKIGEEGKAELPLDKLIPKALEEWRIKAILTMLPLAVQGQKRERSPTAVHYPQGGKAQKKQTRVDNNKGAPLLITRGGKGKGKKKGGPKSAGAEKGTRLPKELINAERMVNGQRPCFAFNLEGCKNAAGNCPMGAHLCMVKGCGLPNCSPKGGARNCPNRR